MIIKSVDIVQSIVNLHAAIANRLDSEKGLGPHTAALLEGRIQLLNALLPMSIMIGKSPIDTHEIRNKACIQALIDTRAGEPLWDAGTKPMLDFIAEHGEDGVGAHVRGVVSGLRNLMPAPASLLTFLESGARAVENISEMQPHQQDAVEVQRSRMVWAIAPLHGLFGPYGMDYDRELVSVDSMISVSKFDQYYGDMKHTPFSLLKGYLESLPGVDMSLQKQDPEVANTHKANVEFCVAPAPAKPHVRRPFRPR